MKNLAQLAAYIRFQLAQLKAQNRHHEFEHLARHFARARICANILPATGSVAAGGDQGRDFETYRTYLASTPLGNIAFVGSAENKKLVFACSLQADIEPKIRADVVTITSGPHVDDIYFFAEPDIPVAKRHALQDWALEKHSVRLEVFDGQALAEGLTQPDVFWIAEEYLAVSAEHYPQASDGDALYEDYKKRWFAAQIAPTNYADFFEIKSGLRKATFSEQHKPDLATWIKVMGHFLASSSDALKRRAQYEICVAALRGQNNLDSKVALVQEYFSDITALPREELKDTAVLLSYCSSAHLQGQFGIEPKQLHEWSQKLWTRLKSELSGAATTPGTRCELYQELGFAALLPYRRAISPSVVVDDAFRYWKLLAKQVGNARLFPLDDFADVLTLLTPRFGKDERFSKLTTQIDELLTKRTGGFAAAEKCRDRAIQYLEAGQHIQAIKQFHTARVHWFAAETLKGSVLSMLTLAISYKDLGLSFAAAYYAMGAALVAFRSTDDSIQRLFPQAVFMAADCYYEAGAIITYMQFIRGAFLAHGTFSKNPGDLDAHDELQRAFAHCAVVRALCERLLPELKPVIDHQLDLWPMPAEYKEEIRKASDDPNLWTRTEEEGELWKRVQADLVARPFSDVGEPRFIEWHALGLRWIIRHANTYDDTVIGEEFAATLQILNADLADSDLGLLPTTIDISVSLRDGISCHIEEHPDNKIAAIEVQFPRDWLRSSDRLIDAPGDRRGGDRRSAAL